MSQGLQCPGTHSQTHGHSVAVLAHTYHVTLFHPNRIPLLVGSGSNSTFPHLSMQHVTPDKIYHVTVMPCYDKKLEASRPDFFSQEHQTRDVDCVVTTGVGPATLSPCTSGCGSLSPGHRLALPGSCPQALAGAAIPCAEHLRA